jgi:hypothetical protein
MQDLYTPTTEGKSNIMETTLDNPTVGNTPTETSTIIQGATGAQYTFVDTSPNAKQNIHALAQQLTDSFALLIKAITELQGEDKQPVSGGEGLHECVDTVLSEADWLMEKLEDAMDNRYDMKDLISQGVDDSVRESVDSFFSNEFSLEDHVDVYSMVETAVEDKLDDALEDKLDSVLEDKINEILSSKNISISFN